MYSNRFNVVKISRTRFLRRVPRAIRESTFMKIQLEHGNFADSEKVDESASAR